MKKKVSLLGAILALTFVLSSAGCSKDNEPANEDVATPNDMKISVEANGNTVIFELNDSSAAKSLYNQLPLTLPVENFGSNEKIFYPPERLDMSNTPIMGGSAGGLAYYEPWGDVIMFYGNYGPMPTLGRAIQGVEHISSMTGTIQIRKVE